MHRNQNHASLMPQSLRDTIARKTIDLFSTLRHWNLTLQQECYLTSIRDFFRNTHGSLMLPPRQPRVFARLGSLAITEYADHYIKHPGCALSKLTRHTIECFWTQIYFYLRNITDMLLVLSRKISLTGHTSKYNVLKNNLIHTTQNGHKMLLNAICGLKRVLGKQCVDEF